MIKNKIIILTTLLVVAVAGWIVFAQKEKDIESQFVTYTVDAQKQEIKLYWKDEQQVIFRSIKNLKNWLENNHETLVFAMNGGMYKQDNSPQGLFIQKQIILSPLATHNGNENFYLKPNGVFYITTDNIPVIFSTSDFNNNGKIKYATQSGPMLVINGAIHHALKKGSTNLNIRNGVGILQDNKVVFAMSKHEINFYDFAAYFKSIGCKNALYLDGLVSRTYLPEKHWTQTDGNFGVIIGITKPAQ